MDQNAYQLAQKLGQLLLQKQWILATAESCTGGLIAASITDIAGSSNWFDRGLVTYSNQAKMDLLNVPEKLLNQHGAVSEQVAAAMAKGALANSLANVSIATTGIAGPGGGSAEKPVGLVWFGFALPDNSIKTDSQLFKGDRAQIRQQALLYALIQCWQFLS